jgi:Lar family restriction alleviation protein
MTKPIQPESVEPCPFCGSEDCAAEGIISWAVDCRECLARGPFADTEAEAITAWNTRIASTTPTDEADFQSGVDLWMDACFGEPIKSDQLERADRFTEEALELVQTMPGFTAERAHALVDYVFGRPVGERGQEVGGVMVCLAALCNTVGLSVNAEADRELARIWTKVEAIRAKQKAKPTGSALPIALSTPTDATAVEDEREWRPIETFAEPTALSSGCGVLVADEDGTVGEAYFRNFDDSDNGWWWANTSWGDYPEPTRPAPTHWQPLPMPPRTPREG